MAPRTRKPSVRRKLNHGLRDGDEMEEQENEQQPDKEVSQKSNQKQVTARTTRRSTANRNARSGFQDNQQMMDHRQQSRQRLPPQIFPQASREHGTGPRTRKATGNQSDCGRLQDQNQMDGDGQRQNEELDFRMTQQTNVSAPRTQRSTVKRNLNHGLLDEDEMGEHEQQENEQHSNLEVTEALQNALKILTAFSTRRETTNQNSHREFQEKHQRQQLQPAISQQVSMMAPTTRKATRNQLGYHRLRDEIQIEGDRQHQEEEQPDFQMTQQVMAPSARRPTAKRKLNHVLIDEDEIEEHELQQNEQQPPVEYTKEIENALKILLVPSTQRETMNLNSSYGLRDKHQVKENGQLQNRQQLQPQINHQASIMAPRTQKATTNQSGYHRLRDEGQMQRDRQHHNEEQPEFQSTQQTTTQHVMARSTQRSTAKRKVNNVLLDEDEVEEHGQQGNEHPSELEVSQAIENALKILMAPSTRGATNENSHCGFQEKHQMKESMHQQSRQQQQPQFSHQASMVPSRIQNAASNRRGYHRLQDEDLMEGDGQHQHEEPPEIQRTQSRQQQQPQFSQQASISAVVPPRSQNTARNQRGYHRLQDEDPMEEDGQHQHEEPPEIQRTQSRQQQPQFSRQTSMVPHRSQNTARNQRGYHRLQDEDSMEEDEQHQHEEPPEIQRTRQTNDKNGTIKRVRGPTFMREVWGKNSNEERIIVNFNKRGQPVGPNKKTFTGFLGTIARNGKYAPLDIEDWRKVSQENKDAMINMVKERFEVPEGSEHWILLSIGKKRNSWRSRVKTQYFDPGLPIENQTHNKPPRVDEDQWKNLLTYWANEDVMEACERNRVHGQQSAMNQTTGKLSFAEIEEELRERLGRSPSRAEMFAACFTHRDGNPSTHEVGVALARMKEYQSKLPPDSQDPVGPNDSFAKVVGNDPPGKVRMLGLGPNPSDLWGSIPSRSTCYRMVLENQAAMTRIEEKVEQFTKLIGSLQERMQPQQNPNNVLKTRIPISPGQSSNSNFIGHKLQVGDSVLLKSLFDHNKIVAKGCLESASPDQYVGGRRLGSNWCAVQISVPMEWDEDLIRPYSNFSTIGDAIGTSVAWPCHLVINEDLQE